MAIAPGYLDAFQELNPVGRNMLPNNRMEADALLLRFATRQSAAHAER